MINPILKKEINILFRAKKIFVITGLYGLALTSIATLMVMTFAMTMSYGGGRMRELVAVFYVIFALQLLMLYLIVPTITAGRISGERERQTLDMLLMTKMKEKDIIKGMIEGSLVVVAMIISVSLPIYGVLFYYESVSLSGLLLSFLYMSTNIIFTGSISIYFSARFKKTITAMIVSLLVLFLYTLAGLIVVSAITGVAGNVLYEMYISDVISQESYDIMKKYLGYLFGILSLNNPIVGFVSSIDIQEGTEMVMNMIEDIACDNAGTVAQYIFEKIAKYDFAFVMIEQILMSIFFISRAAKRLKKVLK